MGGSISDLVPELADFARDLVDAAGRAGLQPRITSTIRGYSEQRRLYNRFLAGQAGYPAAPPGQRPHEYGLASDMVVSPLEPLAVVGYPWQQGGGGWNGSDAVHFELPGASQWARQQGVTEEQKPIGKWIDDLFGSIPWYISAVLPTALLTKTVDQPMMTFGQFQQTLARYGIKI